jgi:peptidoglycan-associated lipoprotein
MFRPSRALPAFALAIAATAVGCSRKQGIAPPPHVSIDDRDLARRDSVDEAARIAREERERLERERGREAARSLLTAPIYFEYDQDELTAEARATLDAKLPVLRANPETRMRIAGHTDERGSDEYNLALGLRRAATAKRYLAMHGVAAERLETASFGEERPAVDGATETAWARNRRAEFDVTLGRAIVARP